MIPYPFGFGTDFLQLVLGIVTYRLVRGVKYYSGNGFFWVRISSNGWGIHIKDVKRNQLTFSERNGFKSYIRLGKYIVSILKPFE